jgi:membrane protease YdiL (CAAX protease family)
LAKKSFTEDICSRARLILEGDPQWLIGLGIVLASILFGYGHYYKSAPGVIDSGVAGLISGTAYMVAGRNLWASIFAHGFIDTFGIIDAIF